MAQVRTRSAKAVVRAALLLVAGLGVSLVALVQPLVASAEGDYDNKDKYSLYGASAAVSASYGKAISPTGGNDAWKELGDDAGTAGGLLGYPDANFFEDVGWFFQSMTIGSKSVSMASLHGLPSGYDGVEDYAIYGATLNALGLDESSTGFSALGRQLIGYPTILAYACAGLVDTMMVLPLQMLQILNPFKFFYGAFQAVSPPLASAMVNGDTSGISGPLKPVVTMMSNIYSLVVGIGWGVAIPLLGALALFSWLALGRGTGGSVIKGMGVRLLFIAIGVPALGLVYTQALDAAVQSGDTGAATSQVVASRWVDFEGWMADSRLGVPANATIKWDTDRRAPAGVAWDDLGDTVLAINNSAHHGQFGSSLSNKTDWQQVSSAATVDNSGAWWGGFNLLLRYTTNTSVSASGYSSTVQASLSESDAKDWFSELRDDPDGVSKSELASNGLVNGGSLTAGGSETLTFTSGDMGLSKMGAYNYLTSVFHADKVDVYSAQASSSLITTPQHKSVTLAGDGLTSILSWLSALVLLGSFAAIGIGYGFGVFMMMLKRGFQLFTSIPMAALGSIRSIAKVISSVVVMIGGLFASIFTYLLVKNLLMVLPGIAQAVGIPLATPIGALVPGAGGGVAMLVVTMLLTLILVLMFTVTALRVRKAIMGGLEQVVDSVLEKIMPSPLGQSMGMTSAGAGGAKGSGKLGKVASIASGAGAGTVPGKLAMAAGDEAAKKFLGVSGGAASTDNAPAPGGGGPPGAAAGGAKGVAATATNVAGDQASSEVATPADGPAKGSGMRAKDKFKHVAGRTLKGAVDGAGKGMMTGGLHGAAAGAVAGGAKGAAAGVGAVKGVPAAPKSGSRTAVPQPGALPPSREERMVAKPQVKLPAAPTGEPVKRVVVPTPSPVGKSAIVRRLMAVSEPTL